jgi:polyphosphate kinase 2
MRGNLSTRRERGFTMNEMPPANNEEQWFNKVYQDVLDNLDEEIEMEVEDHLPAGRDATGKPAAKAGDLDARQHYFRELFRLQAELINLQEWVVHTGHKMVILFEGRDAAGKGGVIKRITQRLNPRVCRVAALPAPTDRERTQWYFQRYIAHLPAAGEMVLFDRSWYNRAGVERVMGFCTEEQTDRFLEQVPAVEQAIVDSGILLLKYWLEVSQDEQTLRLQSRIDDPRKIWKLSGMDLKSYTHWYDYSRARDAMFAASDSAWAPWFVADTNDKRRGRLNIITHLLSQVPYEHPAHEEAELPKRQKPGDYVDPNLSLRHIPTPF